MHKVVVDTNVFISGFLFGGNPRKIIEAWINKKYIFCLSPELKTEIISKLKNKFFLSNQSLKIIEEALDINTEKFIPKKKISICKDPQDNFLLELAEESTADYLISGDKLVLKLGNYKKTKIISPKNFLKLL
ncbi:MAG: putative toxin-antitoxin system toxin component, PIN family [Candidatus Levybacteria bacterium]|nr:putative toxin-antitoxin system toxin component, PIN family [Candidatus Levybacteria bacterium]